MGKVYIVMGVSGCGKTTVGKLLGSRLSVDFYDADDFHSPENVAKMRSGTALNDEDRLPWLTDLAARIAEWKKNEGAVLACSALKESYRRLLDPHEEAVWVVLHGDFKSILERIQNRKGHYMNPRLLRSQFDTLELPSYGIHLDNMNRPDAMVDEILKSNSGWSEFGILGLGVMGRSLAKNLIKKGVSLSVYNRTEGEEAEVVTDFLKEVDSDNTKGFKDIKCFVESLERPRKILLMVPATVVDEVLNSLEPFLDKEDILIDGGNSYFQDTQRRFEHFEHAHIHYFGMGISGGEAGALKGPSLMAGGPEAQYKNIKAILELIAAKDSNNKPCVSYLGSDGCGHFIKMIHNGIEYAEMQLLAECYALLRPQMSYDAISVLFEAWNEEETNSYLLGITSEILKKTEEDYYLLDRILDKAEGKGTGVWSSQVALNLGVSAPMIAAAVDARLISQQKECREKLAAMVDEGKIPHKIKTSELKAAYTMARYLNHYQGFELIRTASHRYRWNINPAEVARIWTGRCIIKSHLMEMLQGFFEKSDDLLDQPKFTEVLKANEDCLQKICTLGFESRTPLPCFSAALNYWYGLSTSDSPANLIQAQRDYFGAHGYHRTDRSPLAIFHSKWNANNG